MKNPHAKKEATIINGRFSYILRVDDMAILFSSGIAAEYFEKHYRDLGYTITLLDQSKGSIETP